jgi:hypothetical protein
MAKKAHTKARKGQKAKALKLLPRSFLKAAEDFLARSGLARRDPGDPD